MAQYLSYKWVHPKGDAWTCGVRQFDDRNDNAKVHLQIPWIKFPMVEEEDGKENRIHWKEIHNRAIHATDSWACLLREMVKGENFPRHEALSCMIQMHEQLLHTIYTLWDEDQYLRLFYGFVADRVAMLSEIASLGLARVIVFVNSRARVLEYEGYKRRLG